MVHIKLAKFAGSAATFPPSQTTVYQLFDACDTDSSGGINRREFDIFLSASSAQIFGRVLVNWLTLIFVIPYYSKVSACRFSGDGTGRGREDHRAISVLCSAACATDVHCASADDGACRTRTAVFPRKLSGVPVGSRSFLIGSFLSSVSHEQHCARISALFSLPRSLLFGTMIARADIYDVLDYPPRSTSWIRSGSKKGPIGNSWQNRRADCSCSS